jgi:uncharacterized integral membrane protein
MRVYHKCTRYVYKQAIIYKVIVITIIILLLLLLFCLTSVDGLVNVEFT